MSNDLTVTDLDLAMGAARPKLAFTLLAAVQFVLIAAITVLSVALPVIQRDLGLTTGDLAMASASYGLSFSGLLLLGGRVADRFGHRRIFVLGVGGFAVATALVAVAPGFTLLVLGRFAQGVAAAFAAPAAMALLGSVYPNAGKRARMTALWGTVASIGATSGTVLSGVVTEFTSWRWMFAVLLAVAVAALAGVRSLLPPGPVPSPTPLDLRGAVLITAALTTLSYGLIASVDRPWTSGIVLGCLAVGVALFAWFGVAQSRSVDPMVPPALVAAPERLAALLAVLVGSAAMSSVFFFMALYLQEIKGYTPLQTSGAFTPFAVALLAAGALSGPAVTRFGARAVCGTGLVVAAAGLLWLSRLGPGTGYGELLIGLLLFPLGMAPMFAGATVRATHGVPDGQAGLAAGVVNTAMEAGPTIGLAVLVSIAASATSSADPGAVAHGYGITLLVAALATLAVALFGLTGRRRPSSRDRRPASTAPFEGSVEDNESNTREEQDTVMGHRFSDKVVLVTGGGSGIGQATAAAFAREGASVVVAGRNAEALAHTVKQITADGGTADSVVADITDEEHVRSLVETVVTRHGGLHIAFNNAGTVGRPGPIPDQDKAVFDTVVATNLTGTWLCLKYEIAHMRANGGGAIVNMASNIGAHCRRPGMATYAASKAAVSVLTRNAARDHIGDGIRINAVSPGATDTTMSRRPGETDEDRDTRLAASVPLGRVGALEEVASAVLWLASDEATFAVGHDLVVDGGATA